MKRSALLILLWVAQLPCFGQQVVRPMATTEFGKPIVVTAEFVAKPNTYYSQNLVLEPFSLKVISVDGQKLKEEVLIEYKLEVGKREDKKLERTGVILEFEAYETLYQPLSATPWLAEGEQGQAFSLVHVLHIRVRRQRANQPLEPTPTAITPPAAQESRQP